MTTLKFSPTAWAKLSYIKNLAKTEVSGFGITLPEDPLYVRDFKLVKQKCTSATTEMDEEGIEQFFDEMLKEGLQPRDFSRVWIHTHPGMSPSPSITDIKTFEDLFGQCSYNIMFILGKNEEHHIRMMINNIEIVERVELHLECEVDYIGAEFEPSDFQAWRKELEDNVSKDKKVFETKNWAGSKEYWGSKAHKESKDEYESYRNQFDGAHGCWTDKHIYNDDAIDYNEKLMEDQTSEQADFKKANDAILEDMHEEEFEKHSQYSLEEEILKGSLKKKIDKLCDEERIQLIDEIDTFYGLEYLETTYDTVDYLEEQKGDLVDEMGGKED